jgi:hypothetical protein
MSAISIDGGSHGAGVARAAADLLGLVATPTFLMMALVTAVFGGGAEPLCSTTQQEWPLISGMVPMYLVMGAFHSAPWLRLLPGRRG